MSFFQQIYPLPTFAPGLRWEDRSLKFCLYVDEAEKVEYFFYGMPYQMEVGVHYPLMAHVELEKSNFCFGQLWSWGATLSHENGTILLGFLIRVWKRDPQTQEWHYRWILDPYARESAGGEQWGRAYGFQVNTQSYSLCKIPVISIMHRDQILRLPVIRKESGFKPRPAKPNHPLEQSIIYECHLRGMTKSASSPIQHREYAGTYRGLVDLIPHFQKLGVTAIELLPIHDFNENENSNISPVTGEQLVNYWGYSTLLFFAPKQNFAFDTANAVAEFKAMVDRFHEAGLEIWLDVVYNHTAEQGERGPIYHFKWLGKTTYYLHDHHHHFANYSGCGNTVHCAHPVVKRLITESLVYWANEMGVDGFRFDLTTILDRRTDGAINHFPHFLWELRQDPALAGVKLVAEPWDAGGGYQVGHLAHHVQWPEWNDRFRDQVRRVVRGDHGALPGLKDAILGSPNVYHARNAQSSINFVTAHDGMTLYDLVAYNHKHNEINGEQNRDGTSENYSYNCGKEGTTSKKPIQLLRHKKMCFFHLLMQTSIGMPMLVGGDEFARTQEGNNNAYCLDNEISWVNWRFLETHRELFEFVCQAIAFRRKNFRFCFSEASHYEWFNSKAEGEDLSYHAKTLVWKITHPDYPYQAICVMLNFYEEPLEFLFPDANRWRCLINSAGASAENLFQRSVWIDSFSAQVFEAVRTLPSGSFND